MIKDLAFAAYSVKDFDRATAFYEGVLGLKPTEGAPGIWQEYEVGSGTFCIGVTPDDAPDFYKRSGASVAFEVDDLDATLSDLKQKNVTLVFGPHSYHKCRMAVIQDPDENIITLHQCKH
jgi:catechol 2,3-dioxygenase-like lactoylglutathione lyase family enzyme